MLRRRSRFAAFARSRFATTRHGQPVDAPAATAPSVEDLDAASNASTPALPDPADVFLDVADVAARYRISRTKAYELADTPGFPASVVPGMKRIPLVALRAWEAAAALAPTGLAAGGAAPAPTGPPPPGRPGRPRTRPAP